MEPWFFGSRAWKLSGVALPSSLSSQTEPTPPPHATRTEGLRHWHSSCGLVICLNFLLQGISLDTLTAAYEAGYRHFVVQSDGSAGDVVGGVVREWLHSSNTSREELFITVMVSLKLIVLTHWEFETLQTSHSVPITWSKWPWVTHLWFFFLCRPGFMIQKKWMSDLKLLKTSTPWDVTTLTCSSLTLIWWR